MLGLAILYILISSASLGVMSEVRKIYQVRTGTGLISTAMFLMVSMFVAFGLGTLTGKVTFESTALSIATIYAGISSVTAMLCLVGSAWGKLSTIIICATLGNLVLPTIYGLIVLPGENNLTIYKLIGCVFAGFTYAMNFCKKDDTVKSAKGSLRYKIVCIVVFFTQGSALIVLNIVNRVGFGGPEFVTLYTGLSSLIMLLFIVIYALFRKKESVIQIKKSVSAKRLFLMSIYAILTLVSERCALACTGMVPLVFQAPVSFCVSIIVISALEYAIYREKLSKVELLQIVFAVICNVMFVV